MYLYKKTTDIKTQIINNLEDRSDYEEIMYWRKDYLIHEWFCDNFEVENCEYIFLEKEDLLKLVEYIKKENDKDRDIDIKKLNKLINEIDWETEEIYYFAWW